MDGYYYTVRAGGHDGGMSAVCKTVPYRLTSGFESHPAHQNFYQQQPQ